MLENYGTKKGPKNTTSEGKHFKSKNRIPRQTRLWLRRKSLASKALRKATTTKACRRLKDTIALAENELSKSYFRRKIIKEDEAIENLIKNPKSFYAHIKKLTNQKTKIGPFVDDKGDIINDTPSEILQKQYSDMWSVPSDTFKVRDTKEFFKHPDSENHPKLCDIKFTKENLIKIIKN